MIMAVFIYLTFSFKTWEERTWINLNYFLNLIFNSSSCFSSFIFRLTRKTINAMAAIPKSISTGQFIEKSLYKGSDAFQQSVLSFPGKPGPMYHAYHSQKHLLFELKCRHYLFKNGIVRIYTAEFFSARPIGKNRDHNACMPGCIKFGFNLS